MSKEFDNTNRGILSRNDRKEAETHADFKGEINVGGTDYWLSAWVKERKDGSGKFFSLSVKPKEAPVKTRPAKVTAGDDDELPF